MFKCTSQTDDFTITNPFPQDSLSPTTVSSPSCSRLVSQIIGAEDDYFDSDQEQVFLFFFFPHDAVFKIRVFSLSLKQPNKANFSENATSVK